MPDLPNKLWTRDEFLKRFTDGERVAMHRASLAPGPAGDAVALALQTFNAKSYISSGSPSLAGTLQDLVGLDILTTERKAQILDTNL